MRLIYTDNTELPTREEIQAGYGIKNPERISGYAGFFFKLYDIYAIGRLESLISNDPKILDELLKLIQRYKSEDFGFVTADEYYDNMEGRYLCGSCVWSIARYGLGAYGGVVLQFVMDKGLMYCADDDIINDFIKDSE